MREEIQKILTPEEIYKLEAKGINLDSDLLDPKIDIVFKAMFTSNSEASRKALTDFLSSVLNRRVTSVTILSNELANENLYQKQSLFDIHVQFDRGEEANIEMQMALRDNFINRTEYNVSKMYSSQLIKGRLYRDLKKVYIIAVMNFTLFLDRTQFMDEYKYRNAEGKVLSGNTQIIFIELSKLEKIEQKQVAEMDNVEKWAIFLKYANNKSKQDLIQKILLSEEGIRMGAEVLETISKDRAEFIEYFRQLKAEIDRDSQMAYEREVGQMEGQMRAAMNMIKNLQLSINEAMAIAELSVDSKEMLVQELHSQKIAYKE